MEQLAASSGTILYENENRLYLVKRPAGWIATSLFVTGLLALILLANGLMQFFVFEMQPHLKSILGITLLVLGILCTLIFWRIMAYRKKINAIPVKELMCICIIDLAANNLLDGQQNLLAPLENVHLTRKMQFTSSSPELVLKWNKKTLSIVQGNPFSGGISAVEKALIDKGIKRK
jgi:uncharacterized membrane protein